MYTIPIFSHTSYIILSSGLTEKTRLFFTSSNASFIDCVSKDRETNSALHHSNLFTSFPLKNNSSPVTINSKERETNNLINEHQTLDSSVDFSFSSWSKCSYSKGGALLFQQHSGGSLTITSCKFSTCSSSSDFGGAICVQSIGTFLCISTTFYDCHAYGRDGGGLEAYLISDCTMIHECMFISNTASHSGGGIVVAEIGTTTCDDSFPAVISESQFIGNEAIIGAGLHMRPCISTPYIYNSLLCSNTGIDGGGLQFITDGISSISSLSFSFLFFSHNSATNGNDIQIEGRNLFSVDSFIQCFSTTKDSRISPSGNDNWLPYEALHSVLFSSYFLLFHDLIFSNINTHLYPIPSYLSFIYFLFNSIIAYSIYDTVVNSICILFILQL